MSLAPQQGLREHRGPATVQDTPQDRRVSSFSTPVALLRSIAVLGWLVTAIPAVAVTVEVRPAVSADDAEESATGSMYTNSGDLELVFDGSNQVVGIRFPGLAIPAGATITAAWVQFSAKESHTEATALTFAGEAADNAAVFGFGAAAISPRQRTSATVAWSPSAWTAGQTTAAQRTPDLSAVIQQVVGRAGWASGNALALIVTGTGHRTAYAFDNNPALAPLLHVEYSSGTPPPPVDNPPVAVLSVSQAASPALTVNASGAGSTDTDATPIASYRFEWGDGTPATTTTAPTATATHTYAAAGTYTVTLRATDTGGLTSAPATASVTVAPAGSGTSFELRPAAGSDDAEESATLATTLSSGDIELVFDGSNQTVGIRWAGVSVPAGATITSAWVQFTADESHTEATALTLRAQAADNAATFAATSGNVSSRPRTTAQVSWNPAAWTAGQAGAAQRTPELKTLLQEVVNRAGWASGNALALIVTGTGHRTAFAVESDPARSALLHVEYTTGSPPPPTDNPPVAVLSLSQAASPALTVNASGAASTDTDATPIASYRFEWGDGTAATVTTAPTATATHTYAAAGTYTVTLRATDTAGLVSSPATSSITLNPPPPPTSSTIDVRTVAQGDDAEESATGTTNINSSDLELVFDGNNQVVGIRWPGVGIGQGATITSAWVQFTADEAHTEVTNLTVRAQAADNAALFTTATRNVSSRAQTTASASWSPAAWTANQAGAAQRTSELKALLQEVVNRPGWAYGNALALIFTGTGHRTAAATSGASTRWPLLHVEFTGGSGPADQPPVAALSVTQVPTPARTVSADGGASTDTDATPIASYRFEWGDGTAATTTTAPTATATHTYAATGTYTVTLRVTDTAGLVSAPVTRSITVSTQSGPPIAVNVGYYDTHHPDNTQPKPNPWKGSAGVVFVGTSDNSSGGWDTSCLKIDNLSGGTLTLTATVDIGSNHFALWGSRSVPAGQSLILAQTGFENFDGSDTNPAGCYGCSAKLCLTAVQSTVPVVNITINGTTTRYYDTGQVLNTLGVDAAGCPATSGRLDESRNWVRIFSSTQSAATPESNSPIFANPQNERVGLSWMGPPFPNPTRQHLSLHFQTGVRGQVNLSVYDIAGRLVRTEMEADFEPGAFQKTLPVHGLAAGMYYLQLRTPEGTLRQKFIVNP